MTHPTEQPPHATQDLEALLAELLVLRDYLDHASVERLRPYAARLLRPGSRESACNLAHYLALRRFDLRPLQQALARNGLSSLGRSEAHVLGTLDRIIHLVSQALQRTEQVPEPACPAAGFEAGVDRLAHNTAEVLGPARAGRQVRIMVTLPPQAGDDPGYLRRLMTAGMDCARINCAHDDAGARLRMIENLHRAAAELGRGCPVLVDLAGQKLRSGPLETFLRPLHIKPHRDVRGVIRRPATVLLEVANGAPVDLQPEPDARLRIPDAIASILRVGDRLAFADTREKQRILTIERAVEDGCWLASCGQSTYLDAGTRVWLERHDEPRRRHDVSFHFEGFAREAVELRVCMDDPLLLRQDGRPGHAARHDDDGRLVAPATIGCLGGLDLGRLRPGDPVWFDDGQIGAEVVGVDADAARLRITQAKPGGSRLRPDKGINFPNTPMQDSPLTARDLEDLDAVVAHADAVGFSFVESAQDMEMLIGALAQRGAEGLPIIAKIETRRAVRNLPDIILAAIGRHPLGVMIARGDLAVEVGPERMAELQEEILWVCEAAHIPVIWATQVLETLVKKGSVSRPELTDAAMANRAECVMLNKGPHIERALRSLGDILVRMQDHQVKKSARLRALHW